jgi:hypothetical protein
MVIANDGGAAISFDFGASWSTQLNMPTGQFYRINADNLFPYNVYAGQQDYSSAMIANMANGSSGISMAEFSPSAGGESAFLAFDPDNPRYVMGGSYLGTIEILDTKSKGSTQIMAAPIQYLGREARNMKYLYNWNAPIIRSQHEPNAFYHGAQLVLKTTDMGVSWKEMSPDLTRDIDEKQGNGGGPYTNEAVGAENYGTLAYLIESPHEKGVFYSGSDDGFVQITKDNMQTWQNITPKVLKECLINAIEVSPHEPATAYIATTRYKFNDYTPAIYKTADYGKTWTNISAGIPYGAFTRVVREDPNRKGLLYAGTEKGIYISYNDGKNWESLQLNLPVTPITDLKVHQGDLIVATSGRAFWILDDLELLPQYESPKKQLHVYKPAPAYNGSWRSQLNGNAKTFKGTHPFNGVNPANGLVIYYELPELKDSTVLMMEIRNAEGNLVRSLSSEKDPDYKPHNGGGPSPEPLLSKNKGLNRFVWNMSHNTMPGIPGAYIEAGFNGHKAIPGIYDIQLKVGDKLVKTRGEIKPVPTFETKPGQYEAFDDLMTEMETKVTEMHHMVNTLYCLQGDLKEHLKDVENAELKKEVDAVLEKMEAWDNDMIQRKSQAYDDVENFPNKFTAEYLFLINQTSSSIPRVNKANLNRKQELDEQWTVLKSRGKAILEKDLPAVNKKLWENGIGALKL